ncbi:MAG: hypothetical protein M3458_10350 [Acidobacteriota bacterium]|nr:hypothetical protein [Acidobacteriota bacterium]
MKELRNIIRPCLVATLCCIIMMPMLATAQSDAADETALRLLAEKFLDNFQKEDANGVMALWSDKSPHIAINQQSLQQTFSSLDQIELKAITIRYLSARDGRAMLRVAAEMSAVDAKTGLPAEGLGKIHRTLHFISEDGKWKIQQYLVSEEDLAHALVVAQTEQEQDALLKDDKELQTVELRKALIKHGENLIEERKMPQALTIFGSVAKIILPTTCRA